MSRRIALIAVLAALLAGCGTEPGNLPNGTASSTLTPDQRAARLQLVKENGGLNDRELAKLCPALYPTDFETAKKYKDIRDKQKLRKTTFAVEARNLARRAVC